MSEDGSISAMINRFRNDKPMSRADRAGIRGDKGKDGEFWWIEKEGDVKAPLRPLHDSLDDYRDRDRVNRSSARRRYHVRMCALTWLTHIYLKQIPSQLTFEMWFSALVAKGVTRMSFLVIVTYSLH